jgi:hypothetical protein
MLSRSFESKSVEDNGALYGASGDDTVSPVGNLQDDVERLLEIAGQLFSTIEDHIHRIEDELARECDEEVRGQTRTLFKERLIRCAESLDASIRDIGHHLDRRANEHIVNYELRDFA